MAFIMVSMRFREDTGEEDISWLRVKRCLYTVTTKEEETGTVEEGQCDLARGHTGWHHVDWGAH